MKTHELIQGSEEWKQFRLTHFGASEAAAMLGISTKVKRNELLYMKKTGTAQQFSEWTVKNILNYGHEVEALARPIAEELIQEELYPITCSSGKISASCDGLTMDESIAWEHKQCNAELVRSVQAGYVPEEYMPQCQQILFVTGAKKLLFMVSDGTKERMGYVWVIPDQGWFLRIYNGWIQFSTDLSEYEHKTAESLPVAKPIMQLPTLSVQIKGEVVLSNLPMFKEAAERFIDDIKTELETDEDFVQADENVKFCEKAEKDLERAKEAAIGQTASIDELMRTIDFIKERLRAKRLSLEKTITKKRSEIKEGIFNSAKLKFAAHIKSIDENIHPTKLVYVQPNFELAAKNKRTLSSLQNSVDTELANQKIASGTIGDAIKLKQVWFKEEAEEYNFLFHDMQQVIYKPADEFRMLVKSRINGHKIAEEMKEKKREADRIEAEKKANEIKLTTENIFIAPEVPTMNRPTLNIENILDTNLVNPFVKEEAAIISRPSDTRLIFAISQEFDVEFSTALQWLSEIDYHADYKHIKKS